MPDVTVFPAASSMVAVNVRVAPEPRFAVDPESTICVAGPKVTVTVSVFELVDPWVSVALA